MRNTVGNIWAYGPVTGRGSYRARGSRVRRGIGVIGVAVGTGLIAGLSLGASATAPSAAPSPGVYVAAPIRCQWSYESGRKVVAFGYGERLTVRLRHGRKVSALPVAVVEGRNVWVVRLPKRTAEDDVLSVKVDRSPCETS